MTRPPDIQPDWALFLDFDGTLIDIAPRPELVQVPAELPALLTTASAFLHGAVAIVSGRELHVIDSLLSPFCAAAGGEHGAVVRMPDGALNEALTPLVPHLWLNILDRAAERSPGLVIERKARSVVVHYRLAPQRREEAKALVEALPGLGDEGFVVLGGHMTFEVKPRGISKRRAVAVLMDTPVFAGRRPVFVGDDITDEDGMAIARERGGLGLQVAGYFRNGPADVRAWIARGTS
jgi:trehalose 6-phosphate phosphatase